MPRPPDFLLQSILCGSCISWLIKLNFHFNRRMKPKVFLTSRMPAAVMERLERETDLAWHVEDRAATTAEIIAGMKGRDALFCSILDRIDAELLDGCPGLKVVANFGVGFNQH